MSYTRPIFTESEILKFESFIDSQIDKGNSQITLGTNFLSEEMQRFAAYLGFHYPSGSFSRNPDYRNYRIAKKGKKYAKRQNW